MKSSFNKSILLVFFIVTSAFLSAQTPVLAVMYFDSPTDDADFPYFQKALNEMLVADLSMIGGLTLVERENLNELFNEMKMGDSGLVDESTAPEMGKLLGSSSILMGTILLNQNDIIISYKLLDSETAVILGAGRVKGRKKFFLDIHSRLSISLADRLKTVYRDINITSLPQPESTEISYNQASRLGEALDSADQKDFVTAEKILTHLTKELPTLRYAENQLDKIRARLQGYDKVRTQQFKKDSQGEMTWDKFYKTLMGYGNSMKFNALLEFCDQIENKIPQAPDGYLFDGEEIFLYYKVYGLHSLQKLSAAVELGETFLQKYPTSMYFQGVRTFVDQDVQILSQKIKVLDSKDNQLAEYNSELKKAGTEAEKMYWYYQSATYLNGKSLYKEAINELNKIDIKVISSQHISGDMVLYALFYSYYGLKEGASAKEVYNQVKLSYPDSYFLSSMESMVNWAGD